jgi:hypothetical protein
MELIKILLEQSTDYSNWNTTKPSDFSTSKYDVTSKVVSGRVVISYKLKETGGTPLSEYVGKYKTNTTPSIPSEITIVDNKLLFDYTVLNEEMTPTTDADTFMFTYLRKDFTVKFTRGTDNKVNGYTGEIFGKTITATKEGSTSSSSTSGTAGTSGSSGSAGSAGSSGTTTVINKQYTKYDAITPDDRIKGFKWHDCENKDFPYEFGCKNKNLGQMNKCLFGTTLNGIFGDELWENITDLALASSDDKKEITLTMYEKVMTNCKQQEESTKRKKIIKENTYKILNQFK